MSKGSHTVLVRSRAVHALGCLLAGADALGSAPVRLGYDNLGGDAFSDLRSESRPGAASAGGLLAEVQTAVGLVKKGVRALEGATAAGAAAGVCGGVGGAAAWALAAVCVAAMGWGDNGAEAGKAVGGEGKTGGGDEEEEGGGKGDAEGRGSGVGFQAGGERSTGQRAMNDYPADGAVRSLVEALVELSRGTWPPAPPVAASVVGDTAPFYQPTGNGVASQSAAASAPHASAQPPPPTSAAAAAASILRCLSRCPRLPAYDFGALCRRLLSLESSVSAAAAAPAASLGTASSTAVNEAAAAAAAAGAREELELGIVGLALSHGEASATGLSGELRIHPF